MGKNIHNYKYLLYKESKRALRKEKKARKDSDT